MKHITAVKDFKSNKWNLERARGNDDSIANALQEVITKEVKSRVANSLAIFADMMGEAVEQLFRAAILSGQGNICTVCTKPGDM